MKSLEYNAEKNKKKRFELKLEGIKKKDVLIFCQDMIFPFINMFSSFSLKFDCKNKKKKK